MQIRTLINNDIESISLLHKQVFDNSYFSVHFSINKLNKYFESLLSANKYCYVVAEDKKILGYVIGGYQTQKAVDNFMKSNIWYILSCMLINPKFILSAIVKIFSRIFTKKQQSKAKLRLFLIGVDQDTDRKGIGSVLLNKFEEELLDDGIHTYGLYVRSNNSHAMKFYEKKEFRREFARNDLICYIKSI